MLTLVTDAKKIRKYHDLLGRRLREHVAKRQWIRIGGPGFNVLENVSYSEDLGIWWDLSTYKRRYWNAFGIGDPSDPKNAAIVCEINYMKGGVAPSLAGAFAEDDAGQPFLVHSGKIGGGRVGVGKSAFWNHFVGTKASAVSDGSERDFAKIGSLLHQRFPLQLALFVKEISRIKSLITTDTSSAGVSRLRKTFHDEFAGKKTYNRSGRVDVECDHGLLVNTLKDLLSAKGMIVGNDFSRDLYVLRRGKVRTLFEVKTNTDLQSIYTAIGQLLLNSVGLPEQPKLVMVVPAPFPPSLRGSLRELEIRVVPYRWKDNRAQFTGLAGLGL